MTSSKKINLYMDFAAGVYLSKIPSPPLPDFSLGWSSNFVCCKSGQIQILTCRIGSQTEPISHCISKYLQYTCSHREGEEELNQREG